MKSTNRISSVWLAVLVAAAIIIPRTWLISRAHSVYWDDQYHLIRGLAFLRHDDIDLRYNDPPLGEALLAMPMWAMGCKPVAGSPDINPPEVKGDKYNVLFDQPVSPETILRATAIWKAILFLPIAAIAFDWCRRLYGTRAAWLALAMVLIDPTIAANIPPAALDVLGMEGVLLAACVGWRYFESPTRGRLIAAGVACATAMLLKHTAIVVPIVFALYAIVLTPGVRQNWRGRFNAFAAMLLIAILSIWVLTLFDISTPKRYTALFPATYTEHWAFVSDVVNPILDRRWPAGIYIGSLFEAVAHSQEGHPAFLKGRIDQVGWWYYIPVIATYKVPIGFFIVAVLAIASLAWCKPRREEASLLIPALVLLGFLMSSRLSIGFRHALPAYIFLIMLASRAATAKLSAVIAWLAVAASAVHVLMFHPNELTYVNFPRRNVHLQISDSNLDWGQSLKQARSWLDAHPQSRPVHVAVFTDPFSCAPHYYLGPSVHVIMFGQPAPHSGLLILSPVLLAGPYDPARPYDFLKNVQPIAIIGNCMRVYDLDDLHHEATAQ